MTNEKIKDQQILDLKIQNKCLKKELEKVSIEKSELEKVLSNIARTSSIYSKALKVYK